MRRITIYSSALLAFALTACQQQTSNPMALQAVQRYTSLVSSSLPQINTRGIAADTVVSTPITNGVSSSFNSFSTLNAPIASTWSQPGWGSNWNAAANTGVWGSSLMYPSMGQNMTQCQSMVQSIPTSLQNLDLMMGTLERCLFRLAINQSGIMNYMWNNSGSSVLGYAGYLNDPFRPAQYGAYSQNPYAPFLQSGQTGSIAPNGAWNTLSN